MFKPICYRIWQEQKSKEGQFKSFSKLLLALFMKIKFMAFLFGLCAHWKSSNFHFVLRCEVSFRYQVTQFLCYCANLSMIVQSIWLQGNFQWMLIFNMMHAWVRKWHSNSKAGLQAGLDYGVTILFVAEFLKVCCSSCHDRELFRQEADVLL